jgi:hypothetical protein
MCALTNPGVSYLVFGDYYRVNSECVRRRNQASIGEVVSVTIFELAATRFSVAIFESSMIVCADESRRQLGNQCR